MLKPTCNKCQCGRSMQDTLAEAEKRVRKVVDLGVRLWKCQKPFSKSEEGKRHIKSLAINNQQGFDTD